MTTRNFRVHNGISVGDIVISASANTISGLATAAPSADGDVSNKKYVDDSIAAISTTAINQGNSNVTVTDSGTGAITVSADATEVANFAAAATTITATGAINLTAGSDVVIPANIGLTFGTGEKIEGDNTDLTVTSGGAINLTAGTDVVLPANIGLTFGSGEKIEGDNTDLTVTSGGAINLTAGTDVVLPANIGLTFGDAGEKIEGNGTNLTITSSGTLDITATGTTTVTNNFDVGGNMTVSGNLTVQGTETIIATQNLNVEDSIIGLNSNVSDPNNMPRFSGIHLHRGDSSLATEVDLYMVWDDAVNASGTTTNLGGCFTFMGSVHESGSESPNSGSFILADIKASTIEANLTGTATAAEYSDVAERFASDSAYEPGTVVALGGAEEITAVNEEASDEVFGVISSLSQAAFKMNGGAGNDETHPYIAMTGRVNVKVIGSVNKGDRLISASVPGYARAAIKSECTAFNVIGRALTGRTELGQGSVLAAVRVSH
jgi:hypothetical protein